MPGMHAHAQQPDGVALRLLQAVARTSASGMVQAWIGMRQLRAVDTPFWVDGTPVSLSLIDRRAMQSCYLLSCTRSPSGVVLTATCQWLASECTDKHVKVCEVPPLQLLVDDSSSP